MAKIPKPPVVLEKTGKFYVQGIQTNMDTPIDGFMYVSDDKKHKVYLAGRDDCWMVMIVKGRKKKNVAKNEWFDSESKALRRMADILEGLVSFKDFGNW